MVRPDRAGRIGARARRPGRRRRTAMRTSMKDIRVWLLGLGLLFGGATLPGCGDNNKKDGEQVQFQPTDQDEAEASSRFMEEMSKGKGS